MTAPTVAVTVRLADFGGPEVSGVTVTAKMSEVDYTADGTFISTETVQGDTVNGEVVLNVFPNATHPNGLGTRGTTIKFTAFIPNSKPLKVFAVIPNEACNLVDCLVDEVPAADLVYRGIAKNWATKTNGVVDGTDYSAKEFAQGSQPATGGSAKNWAQEQGPVTGAGANDRSAKSWAQESLPGATLGGSSKDWAQKTDAPVDGTEFSAREHATGSQNGTGGSAKNWAQQTGGNVSGAAAGSRSSKAWAQDDLTPDGANLGGSAKDWATSNTLPDGANKSAKGYAQDTAADRVQTGLDRVATAGDRTQTGLDRVQTGLDRAQTGSDRTQTGSDRVASSGSAAAAAGSQGAAALSATQASSYAAAAATGAKFFDTIALGRAGVADTFTFGVKAGGSDGLLRPTIYRRDSAGTQTLLYAVIPGAEIDARFPLLAPTGYVFGIVDADGVMAFGIRTDGTVDIANLSLAQLLIAKIGTPSAVLQDIAPVGFTWGVMDSEGRLGFGIRDDGTAVAGALEANSLNGISVAQIIAGAAAGAAGSTSSGGSSSPGNFDAEVNGFDAYGQSKSNGTSSVPPITTVQNYDNLKFNGGVRASDAGGTAAANHASLQPLTETADTGSVHGETPMGGTTDYIKQRIASKYSISYAQQSYQMLGSSAGAGGTAIAGLSNGTGPFNALKDNISYGYALSQAAGKTYKFRGFGWSQGESDYQANTPGATYETALIQLRTDLDTYAKSITGQADNVLCIIDQVCAHGVYGHANDPYIALRQLKITKEQASFYMACPVYFLPQADNPHFTAAGSKWLGAYYGRVYTRVAVEGGTWKPLQPLSSYRQGSIAIVRLNVPTPPLVFDVTLVAAVANKGFTLVDASNVAITISSVSIIEKDTVKIVAAAPIPAGAKLRYGFPGAGNLRDSDIEVFDVGGVSKPLYNWCVIFEETLA